MNIVYNAIQTPDGTILVSRHRHDFVQHTDNITGDFYAVDGGSEYLKRCFGNNRDYKELSLTTDDPHDKIREVVQWGKRLENGRVQYILVKDLTDSHLRGIVDYIRTFSPNGVMLRVMQNEFQYRKEINVKVQEPEQADDQDRKAP
jgi:hypothetical protein